MKLLFMGFTQSKGDYVDQSTGECKPYDNIVMDCMSNAPVKSSSVVAQAGRHYMKVKFKTEYLSQIFCDAVKSVAELPALCGKYLLVDGTLYNTKQGKYLDPDEIAVSED